MKFSILIIIINDALDSNFLSEAISELPLNRSKTELSLLHIIKNPSPEITDKEKYIETERTKSKNLLEKTRALLVEKKFKPEQIKLEVINEPYTTISEGIIDHFKKDKYQLVMLSRKRMSKTEEFLMGDLSNKLIHSLDGAAILVIKTI